MKTVPNPQQIPLFNHPRYCVHLVLASWYNYLLSNVFNMIMIILGFLEIGQEMCALPHTFAQLV
jgi:hypothetical protein